MADYDEYPDVPNEFFVKCNTQYDNERELYSVLQMEGWNQRGVQMIYYPVSINGDYLFGEDNARVIERRFEYMAYYSDASLPKEDKMFNLMGVPGIDQFIININKYHFTHTSQYNSFGVPEVYPEYYPKIGDIVKAKYNNQYYEVVMVKEEKEIFLQAKHSWVVYLINYKNKGYLLSEEMSMTNDDIIPIVNNMNDIYQLNQIIDVEKRSILFNPPTNECPPQPNDTGW